MSLCIPSWSWTHDVIPQPGCTDATTTPDQILGPKEQSLLICHSICHTFDGKSKFFCIIQDHKGFLQKNFILDYIFSSLILKNFVPLLGALILIKSFYPDRCWFLSSLLVIQNLDYKHGDIRWIIPQKDETTCFTLKWNLYRLLYLNI